jgi:hypothetical protein
VARSTRRTVEQDFSQGKDGGQMRTTLTLMALLVMGCGMRRAPSPGAYLYLWAGDSSHQGSDFLAVIDADTASRQYGEVVTSISTGMPGGHPHHTEHEMPADGHLLANDFMTGHTWLFDLTSPRTPRVLTSFGDVAGFRSPHSFIRMADGNVIATFQYQAGTTPNITGGLVEMDERGEPIRSTSARDTTIADTQLFPYSVLPIPALDRAVSTTTDMDQSDTAATGQWVQIWRLSDLTLLRSIALPPGPLGSENRFTGEPRLLADGRSAYIHTFQCGLYLLRNVDQPAPAAQLVWTFKGENCGVPVMAGRYWLQPVPAVHGVVALDIADPAHPREVSRVGLGDDEAPHWMAMDPTGRRLVVNSGGYAKGDRLFVVNFDPADGHLALDGKFRDPGSRQPGLDLARRHWPHGFTGRASPHGVVFSR